MKQDVMVLSVKSSLYVQKSQQCSARSAVPKMSDMTFRTVVSEARLVFRKQIVSLQECWQLPVNQPLDYFASSSILDSSSWHPDLSFWWSKWWLHCVPLGSWQPSLTERFVAHFCIERQQFRQKLRIVVGIESSENDFDFVDIIMVRISYWLLNSSVGITNSTLF